MDRRATAIGDGTGAEDDAHGMDGVRYLFTESAAATVRLTSGAFALPQCTKADATGAFRRRRAAATRLERSRKHAEEHR